MQHFKMLCKIHGSMELEDRLKTCPQAVGDPPVACGVELEFLYRIISGKWTEARSNMVGWNNPAGQEIVEIMNSDPIAWKNRPGGPAGGGPVRRTYRYHN
jgi:hypothetical protein